MHGYGRVHDCTSDPLDWFRNTLGPLVHFVPSFVTFVMNQPGYPAVYSISTVRLPLV